MWSNVFLFSSSGWQNDLENEKICAEAPLPGQSLSGELDIKNEN